MSAWLKNTFDRLDSFSPKNIQIFSLITIAIWLRCINLNSDSNWDLLNYHIYDVFALLNKPFGYDIVPAMLQTYLNPVMDVLPYVVRQNLNDYPKLVNCILALPHIVALCLIYLIGLRMIPPTMPHRSWLALLATFFGASGTASLPPLATSQSDMIAAVFLYGAMLIVLDQVVAKNRSGLRLLGAGVCLGVAVGLKLTLAPYMIALGLATLITCGENWRIRLTSTIVLGCGVALGLALVGGPWWALVYAKFGSPLFPYFNNILQSPWYPLVSMTDDRFLPKSSLQALFYPFHWMGVQNTVDEWRFRDWRYAITYVAVVMAVIGSWQNRLRAPQSADWFDRKSLAVLVFTVVSYVLWEKQFSILRYLAPIELLLGVACLVALRPWLAMWRWRYASHAAMLALTAVTLATTVYPGQPRTKAHTPVVNVEMPILPSNASVLLLDDEPMAFLAAYAPTSVRFIGVNNNMMHPGVGGLLQEEIEALVRHPPGPLYGAISDHPTFSNQSLDYYHLRLTAECAKVSANILDFPIQICRLESSL